ncbi:MAG: UbiA-like polyprenyltransferase [Pyrinomonadaceae bacterium]
MSTLFKKFKITLQMIKFEHTLFALPFAFMAAVLAANGLPSAWQILWITMAMVGARSAAMSFNRIIDRDFDAKNPRTSTRELPSGTLSVKFAWAFMFASCALFLFSAAMLNRLTLLLSPIALVSVLGYSYAKRFTSLAHLLLGWALAIAPTGAWIAVRGTIDSPVPLLISLFVLLWTAGFDVLYSCQDYEFDKNAGLQSIPARFGIARSLWIARGFHLAAFVTLLIIYFYTNLGYFALIGVILTGALLLYQHSIVKQNDLSKVNAAFFTANAFVSVILFASFFAAVLIAN